ncbi:MAG: gpW family head-tail joining protein [Pseudomonadota bacterium]
MTPEEQLADAKAKYHLLVTGQLAKVYVDENGERVEFTSANSSKLLAYIERLERQINQRPVGPMQGLF